ncbi:MAG TPA: EAL domain-containing protein [Acetobacteraceae bacterium]|nr:EAL domain-containing protein [Acetobacteraceae bacterium]
MLDFPDPAAAAADVRPPCAPAAAPPREHRWYRNAYIAIVVAAALVIAVIGVGTATFLARARNAAIENAKLRAQNAAVVAVNTINRQLLQVDSALASLPPLFGAALGEDRLSPQAATRLLRAFNYETFVYRDLLLVRPNGAILASARPRPGGERLPPFPAEAAAQPGGVAVEGPIVNPGTGDESWYLKRDVVLAGIGEVFAIAEVPVPSIIALLAPVAEVPGLHIAITRANRVLLASVPYDAVALGKHVQPDLETLAKPDVPFLFYDAPRAHLAVGIWAQTLYPDVRVALDIDVTAALADWQRERKRLVLGAAAFAVLVLFLSGALIAALRQRELVERERRDAKDRLDDAIESMSDGFVMWDAADRLVTCNRRYRELYSVSTASIRPGARFEDIVRYGALRGQYPQSGGDVEQFVAATVEWHRNASGTLERLLPDGRWILITERRTRNGGIVGIRTDITTLKRALAELGEANERVKDAMAELQVQNVLFTAALNNMSQGLLMVDSDQRLIVCNARFLELFRIQAASARPGTSVTALFGAIRNGGRISRAAVERVFSQQADAGAARRDAAFVAADGEDLALAISQRPLPDGGWVATYEDVTEQQRAAGQIRFMAHHDALTKLPNRVLFRTRVEAALREAGPRGGFALLYLDLDRFKYVNDSLGHPAGDSLLEAAARRLRGCVRDHDFVARLGGDEFAIGMTASAMPQSAIATAERVIKSLSAPYDLGMRRVEVGVSIGIAVARNGETDCDALLKQADMALYQAKAKGRGTYAIFVDELQTRLSSRLTLQADLRLALERGEFELAYQPIFRLADQRLCGFEALLRWRHPANGPVSPALFIPAAEELGLINQIGAWILRRVCADLAELPHQAPVAINLSPVQLLDRSIVDVIGRTLAEFALDPARLEIEITESALLSDGAATTALLMQMHRLGLKIALDDFGTGYSSLSHLRSFPFDKIKIDRLFVSEMATRADCAAIVGSLAMLATRLGMTTVAEGVETEEQLELVRAAGCTAVQGYLFGKPEPLDAVRRRFGAAAFARTA